MILETRLKHHNRTSLVATETVCAYKSHFIKSLSLYLCLSPLSLSPTSTCHQLSQILPVNGDHKLPKRVRYRFSNIHLASRASDDS